MIYLHLQNMATREQCLTKILNLYMKIEFLQIEINSIVKECEKIEDAEDDLDWRDSYLQNCKSYYQ